MKILPWSEAASGRPPLRGIFGRENVHKIFILELVFSVAKPLEISYNTMMKYSAPPARR